MTAALIAYDSTQIADIPADAEVVICYRDGIYANETEARARFPHARILPLTVRGAAAPGLDWEPGNVERDPVDWLQHAAQPPHVIYADLSDLNGHILPRLQAAQYPRAGYKILSAHPTGTKHLCGPHTCGQLPIDADGTQWIFSPRGQHVDISELGPTFFGPQPAAGVFLYEIQTNCATGEHRVIGLPNPAVQLGGPDRWASARGGFNSETGAHLPLTPLEWNAPPLGG